MIACDNFMCRMQRFSRERCAIKILTSKSPETENDFRAKEKSQSYSIIGAQSDLTGLWFTKISKNNAGVQSYKLEKFDCGGWVCALKPMSQRQALILLRSKWIKRAILFPRWKFLWFYRLNPLLEKIWQQIALGMW